MTAHLLEVADLKQEELDKYYDNTKFTFFDAVESSLLKSCPAFRKYIRLARKVFTNSSGFTTYTSVEVVPFFKKHSYLADANVSFYQDGAYKNIVFTSVAMDLYADWYFSHNDKARKEFFENMVNKFVDGKTIVLYTIG